MVIPPVPGMISNLIALASFVIVGETGAAVTITAQWQEGKKLAADCGKSTGLASL